MKKYVGFVNESSNELSGKFSFFSLLQVIGNHGYNFMLNDHYTKLYKYQYYFSTETISDVRELLEVFKYKHSLASTYKTLLDRKDDKLAFFFGVKDKSTFRYGFLDSNSQKSYVTGEFVASPRYFRSIIKYKAVSSIGGMINSINLRNIDILRQIKEDIKDFIPEHKPIKTEIVDNRVIKTFDKSIYSDQDIQSNRPFMALHDWSQKQKWGPKVECSVNDESEQLQFVIIVK